MEQLKAIISQQKWTPQIKTRGEAKRQYLYAVRRRSTKGIEWRYVGTYPELETISEQDILEILKDKEVVAS